MKREKKDEKNLACEVNKKFLILKKFEKIINK